MLFKLQIVDYFYTKQTFKLKKINSYQLFHLHLSFTMPDCYTIKKKWPEIVTKFSISFIGLFSYSLINTERNYYQQYQREIYITFGQNRNLKRDQNVIDFLCK